MIADILVQKPSKKLIQNLKNITQLQQKDEKILKIINNCKISKYKTFTFKDNILYKNNNIVIPKSLIKNLIIETQEIYGHIDTRKTFELLNKSFY